MAKKRTKSRGRVVRGNVVRKDQKRKKGRKTIKAPGKRVF